MSTNEEGGGFNKSENSLDTSREQSNGMANLTLKLAKEILQRNHGMMVEFPPSLSYGVRSI